MSPNSDDPPPPSPSLSRNLSLSRLNAEAPEFVPRPTPPPILFHTPHQFYAVSMPVHRGYAHQIPVHHFQYQEQHQQQQEKQKQAEQQQQPQKQLGQKKSDGADCSNNNNNNDNHQVVINKNGVTDESSQKIINQVEYYFSDVNLATTDHLMRFISKDPNGYVPLSVVSSFKKIKALISSNSQLASILRNSEKLVVSDDGKRVKRLLPLTEADMEELQSRIVVSENLPEDHCHQNLMKVFSAVGSVNSIRTCPPLTLGGGSSSGSKTAKAEGMHYSNKLHAFVEYESLELAEKAVANLNEEDSWRNGLRVRLLHKCTKKSGQPQVKKVENEGEAHHKEDETSTSEQPNEKPLEDCSLQYESHSSQANDHGGEEHINEKDGKRKGRSRGRAKGRGRPQFQQNQNQNYNHNNHHPHHNHNHNHNHHHHHSGNHVGTTPSVNSINPEHPTVFKQPPGPRMPDGTRGFSMGRGKPVAVNNG